MRFTFNPVNALISSLFIIIIGVFILLLIVSPNFLLPLLALNFQLIQMILKSFNIHRGHFQVVLKITDRFVSSSCTLNTFISQVVDCQLCLLSTCMKLICSPITFSSQHISILKSLVLCILQMGNDRFIFCDFLYSGVIQLLQIGHLILAVIVHVCLIKCLLLVLLQFMRLRNHGFSQFILTGLCFHCFPHILLHYGGSIATLCI